MGTKCVCLSGVSGVLWSAGRITMDLWQGFADGSLKYHRLHPEYIHQRIEKMKGMYNVRILLVLCDVVSCSGNDWRFSGGRLG